MKILKPVVSTLLIFLIIGFGGCDPNNLNKNILEPENNNEDLLWKNLINAGFDIENIMEKENYFIVEDDIIITKDELSSYNFICEPVSQVHKISQSVTNGVVNLNKVSIIKIRINQNLFSTGWDTAIRQAIDIWSNIYNCRIQMTEVDNTTSKQDPVLSLHKVISPEIVIARIGSSVLDPCMTLSPSAVAASKFPSNGNPGNQIVIGTNDAFSSTKKREIVLHELGHALGFRHTNWIDVGEGQNQSINCGVVYGANLINGTIDDDSGTGFDDNSIMIQGVITGKVLSSQDKMSARVLYPVSINSVPVDVLHIYENYENDRDQTRIELGMYINFPYQHYEFWYFWNGQWIKNHNKIIFLEDFIYSLPLKIVLKNYSQEYSKTIYTNISEYL